VIFAALYLVLWLILRGDRYNPEKDKAIYPVDVYENDQLLWLRFIVNLHHPNEWKVYNALYKKDNKEIKVAPFKEGVQDDINDFISLQPTFVTPEGVFAQLVSAERVLE